MRVLDVRSDPAEDEGGSTPESSRGGRVLTVDHLFVASIVAVLVPIVVATIRAARSGWMPVGDNAYFLIRSRDVFTENHPLLGTWTSASRNTDTNFNNPGPMMFDLLAIPSKLGGGIGLGVGVAVLNGLCAIGLALMVRRRGGPLLGVAAMVVLGLVCSSLGSELLYDPWQPHSLLLPFLFGLACVWSLVAGDVTALPWAVAVGSLVVQTHLSYAVLVVAVGGWGVLGLFLALRRSRISDPLGWARRRRSVVRTVGVTAVVVAVCWLQPAIENVSANDQGNLSRLAGNIAGSEETVGIDRGTRIVADTMVVPPFWLRPSFEEALASNETADARRLESVNPSLPVAIGLLVGLGALLAAGAWDARRRGDRVSSAGLSTAAVALVAGLVTSWQLPYGVLGLAVHQFRWMWPVGAFTTLTLLVFAIRRGVPTGGRRAQTVALALTALTIVVAASTVPTYNVRSGPVADITASATMAEAGRQMAVLEDEGPLLIDIEGTQFAEPYTGPVMAELQRRGIPFVVDDEGMVRQLGETRRLKGDAQRLLFRQGDAASVTPPGARRVVYVEGLNGAEKRERAELHGEIIDHFVTAGVRAEDLDDPSLSAADKEAISAAVDRRTVTAFVDSGRLAYLVDQDLLMIDDRWHDRIERWAALQAQWAFRTMGLFLAPLGPESGS